ncbi:MAG: hypothetical protein QXG46_05845 [Ignisphaera sp.]
MYISLVKQGVVVDIDTVIDIDRDRIFMKRTIEKVFKFKRCGAK